MSPDRRSMRPLPTIATVFAAALVAALAVPRGPAAGGDPPGDPAARAASAVLPASADLRPRLEAYGLSPRVQGHRGTCSVFTVTGAIEYALARTGERVPPLSPEFLNWALNRAVGKDDDGGFFSDLWRGFEAHGICPEADMPYRPSFDPALQPSREAVDHARGPLGKGLRIHWIKRWDPKRGLQEDELLEARRALAAGWPVCGGFLWPRREEWKDGVLQFRPRQGVRDGHSVLLVGYRDDPSLPGGGLAIIRNTAGPARFGFLTYEYLLAYMNDAVWIGPEGEKPERPVRRY